MLAPEIRETFGISEGTIVFISTASAAFFVLGAVPMGWLADRVKRVPIVGVVEPRCSAFFVFLSGLAVERVHAVLDALRHRHRQGEQHPGAPVADRRQLPDRHPRPDVGAQSTWSAHGIGLASPVLVGAIATWAGGAEGWRWAWFILGIPVVDRRASLAFFMKEPPRGQFEKQDVLGEVIEDEQPAPISMEAAFARLKRIRTIRTVLVGVLRARASACSASGALESLYLDDTLHVDDVLERGLILSLSGIARAADPARSSAATSTACTARTRPRRSRSSAC